MKKSILLGVFAAFLGAATLTGCSSDTTHEEHDTEQMETTAYYCPMKCEGEKTYAEPGSCPKCGMDLVEKE